MITTAYKKIEQITDPLYQAASHYISQIPNCKKELISSFLFSFAIGNVFSGGNMRMSVLSGTAALVATSIHAIATPFFKELFHVKENFTTTEHFLVRIFSLLSTTALFSFFGYPELASNLSTNLVLSLIYTSHQENKADSTYIHV